MGKLLQLLGDIMWYNDTAHRYDPEENTGRYLAELNRKPDILDYGKPSCTTQHPNDKEWAMG